MPFHLFTMERWQSTYENRVAYNLSESGVDPLTVGELLDLHGSDTFAHVTLSYGQSNGSDELRARIAALYAGAVADCVVVRNGSAEANFAAMWHLVRPGDEVAILVPTYMQTHGLARIFGAQVVEIPLRDELGWQPDPDQIRRAVTDRTRVLVVTNPGNPTGAVLAPDVRAAIVEATARTGTWLLADEVYTGAELSGTETPSFFGATERVIATGSLSKAYGLPGLRIGWAVTDANTAEALWARSDYTTIAPGALTDHLAGCALAPHVRPRLLERTRAIIRAGLASLTSWLREQGGFRWRDPDAGAICLVCYDAPIDSAELAELLRARHSVLIVPGAHFKLGRYIRFGIGVPAELPAALERVSIAFRALGVPAR
jgi:aspartate/methionine/tyrosine aminotransferase